MSPEDMFHQQMFEMNNSIGDYNMPSIDKPPIQAYGANGSNTSAARVQRSKKPLSANAVTYQVLLKNPSKFNKKIIDFFVKNINRFNKKEIRFEWIGVYDDDIEYYEEQNITRFPTMIMDNDIIEGTNDILKKLNMMLNSNIPIQQRMQTNQPVVNKRSSSQAQPQQNDGDMKNYFMDMLKDNKDDDEDDEDSKFSRDLNKRVSEMTKARQSHGQAVVGGGNTGSNPEVHEQRTKSKKRVTFQDENEETPPAPATNVIDILKNTKSNDQDDDMMLKFYENQEETEV